LTYLQNIISYNIKEYYRLAVITFRNSKLDPMKTKQFMRKTAKERKKERKRGREGEAEKQEKTQKMQMKRG
jgi:hypothetical protein